MTSLAKYEEWMSKTGWKKGSGLGKNEDGDTKFIEVNKKNNTVGIGGTKFKWDELWWDNVYTSTSKKIGEEADNSLFETGYSKRTLQSEREKDKEEEEQEESSSSSSEDEKDGSENGEVKKVYFGQFTKSKVQKFDFESDTENDDGEKIVKKTVNTSKFFEEKSININGKQSDMTNDTFEACNGRVLRKYVPLGKLARLKEQEQSFMKGNSSSNNSVKQDIVNIVTSSTTTITTTKNHLKEEQKEVNLSNITITSPSPVVNKEKKKSKKEKKDKKEKKEKKEKKDRKEKKDKESLNNEKKESSSSSKKRELEQEDKKSDSTDSQPKKKSKKSDNKVENSESIIKESKKRDKKKDKKKDRKKEK